MALSCTREVQIYAGTFSFFFFLFFSREMREEKSAGRTMKIASLMSRKKPTVFLPSGNFNNFAVLGVSKLNVVPISVFGKI